MINLTDSGRVSDRPDDISRFVKAHEIMYDTALSEIRDGRKQSHWMWYIFPQVRGLGRSFNSRLYGVNGTSEARRYLEHPVLREHMYGILAELLALPGDNPVSVFGGIDAVKLRSSMTLFDTVAPDDIFARVLDKFFDGRRDDRTLRLLQP